MLFFSLLVRMIPSIPNEWNHVYGRPESRGSPRDLVACSERSVSRCTSLSPKMAICWVLMDVHISRLVTLPYPTREQLWEHANCHTERQTFPAEATTSRHRVSSRRHADHAQDAATADDSDWDRSRTNGELLAASALTLAKVTSCWTYVLNLRAPRPGLCCAFN